MSLLEVINLTQGYVDKPLYEEASFDVFKGEHVGVVEAITISVYLHGAFEELYQMEKEIQNLYQTGSENGDDKLFLRAARYQEQLEASGRRSSWQSCC